MIHFRFVNGARAGQRLSFRREPVRAGRSSKAELHFDEAEFAVVSAHHAQVVYERGAYVLVDTGSTNGTLVNGHRVTKRELHSGDRVRFGHPSGPELEVEIDVPGSAAGSEGATTGGSAWADTVPEAPHAGAPATDARQAEQLAQLFQQGVLDQSGIRLVDAAA